mmetsp:Transcript_1465/g.4429  ORF Transcript_1465/g.4429 Transcript_1465/m.4429 type:complete len:433 (+) Transcript_1465:87-1385(+)
MKLYAGFLGPAPALQKPWRSSGRQPRYSRRRQWRRAVAVNTISGLDDPVGQIWLTTAAVFSASTAGVVLEKTKVGGHVSAPLITMLITVILSNLRVIPMTSPVYDVINKYLVPLAIPMLLFEANLRKVLTATGRMLVAFTCGLLGTLTGTVVAWMLVPLGFGGADWKIAAGLCARHIGGALNLVAVSEAVGTDPAILTAVIAADNLAVFFYFMFLFFVSSRLTRSSKDVLNTMSSSNEEETPAQSNLSVASVATAVSVSAIVCTVSKVTASLLPFPSGIISISSVLVVMMATVVPKYVAPLSGPGGILGVFLLQAFFAASGATGSITTVLQSAPQLLLWSGVQLVVHFLVLLGLGKVFRVDLSDLYVASNANVGGPTTAAGMASALNWKDLVVPAILVGILGYASATILSLFLGSMLVRISPVSGGVFLSVP